MNDKPYMDTLPPVGARVRLTHDVDRFPHFLAPAGALGTVVQSDQFVYEVKMDGLIVGAEEWDNAIQWCNDDDPHFDLIEIDGTKPENQNHAKLVDPSGYEAEDEPEPRTILVHLNVEMPASDTRTASEIADQILVKLNGGQEPVGGIAKALGGPLVDVPICIPLAEEV